jgi:hypothetical protein
MAMLFRSTGLGKTELTGQVDTLQRQGDYLVMYVDVTDPVKWRIRVAMGFTDLLKVVSCMARRAIVGYILSPRQWGNREPAHPGEF